MNRAMPQQHHPPPPVKVARRAAEQQQGGERQGEGVDHPLHLGGGGVEAPPDRGQSDVEHRAVDEGEARGEDAGGEDQRRVSRLAAGLGGAGPRRRRASGRREAQAAPPGSAGPRIGAVAVRRPPHRSKAAARRQATQRQRQRDSRRVSAGVDAADRANGSRIAAPIIPDRLSASTGRPSSSHQPLRPVSCSRRTTSAEQRAGSSARTKASAIHRMIS